ncbi:hypothetical protein K4Q65_11380 [Staphylococcus epidermidis]|nr:hypothetical protein [Staphylococcus epidermidis]
MNILWDSFLKNLDLKKNYRKYETLIILYCLILGISNLFTGCVNKWSLTHPFYQAVVKNITHEQFTYNNYLIVLLLIDLIVILSLILTLFWVIVDVIGQRDAQREYNVDKYMSLSLSALIYTFIFQIIYFTILLRTMFIEQNSISYHFSFYFLGFNSLISTVFTIFLLILLLYNGGEDIVE